MSWRWKGSTLGWVLLEVLAALAIAIGIVWWTFPKAPKGDGEAQKRQPGDQDR